MVYTLVFNCLERTFCTNVLISSTFKDKSKNIHPPKRWIQRRSVSFYLYWLFHLPNTLRTRWAINYFIRLLISHKRVSSIYNSWVSWQFIAASNKFYALNYRPHFVCRAGIWILMYKGSATFPNFIAVWRSLYYWLSKDFFAALFAGARHWMTHLHLKLP